jgi:hypothetical protein
MGKAVGEKYKGTTTEVRLSMQKHREINLVNVLEIYIYSRGPARIKVFGKCRRERTLPRKE